MSILSSMYSSMTGLTAYSRALDTISNNVGNLNTLGFKAMDLRFADLKESRFGQAGYGDAGRTGTGAGTVVMGETQRFSQGEIRETGAIANVAIDGNGFFVIRDGRDAFYYTRNGQFEFDAQGRLALPESGAIVQALQDGRLVDFNIQPFRGNPPKPTATVTLVGNLSLGSSQPHVIEALEVIDDSGETQTFKLTFTRESATTGSRWKVKVEDKEGASVKEGELRFTPGGAPVDGYNSVMFSVMATTGVATEIKLDFGEPGGLDGAMSFSGGTLSTLKAGTIDGHGVGELTQVAIDENGQAILTYSNGQVENGPQLALASVRDPQELKSISGSLFQARAGQAVVLGVPGEGAFGAVVSSSVELSNVDLSREFAEIIILQRGFQASSQVLTVANELVEQVYNNLSGR